MGTEKEREKIKTSGREREKVELGFGSNWKKKKRVNEYLID